MNSKSLQGTESQMVIVISGPSGAGKDSVVRALLKCEQALGFVITTTTRPMRADEVHGRDYFFVSGAEFARMIAVGEFIEHSVVYGEQKGVSRKQVQAVLKSGKSALLRVDVQGASRIRQIYPSALSIFLTPGDEDELRARLFERETETTGEVERRVSTARDESQHSEEFDYVVVNHRGDLEGTVKTIHGIIRAEYARMISQTR